MRGFDPDLAAFVIWSLGAFGAGVSWAAYRAVSWVDRMRAWAYSIPGASLAGGDSISEGGGGAGGPEGVRAVCPPIASRPLEGIGQE